MSDSSTIRLPVSENQSRFKAMVEQALDYAKTLGASDAVAEVSESSGQSVAVRHQEIDTMEQTRDRGLSITVYAGQRRGSASTSDFSTRAIEETVAAAWHIARYTAEDEAALLPDKALLATEFPDLDLYHPWELTADEAVALAREAEHAALEESEQITNSDGAEIDTYQGHFVLGNTAGFLAGYPYSRHSLSVAPIAGKGEAMQRDYWYTVARASQSLEKAQQVGQYAAQRALSRLGARRIATGRYPVLFEAPLALGLVGALVRATSGGALYRGASFLLDSLGQEVLASHLHLLEDPFVAQGLGSSIFDAEGVRTQRRNVVEAGRLQGYFLSSYTARKLGMTTTGNAGGSHNLILSSDHTVASDNLSAMLQKMGTGLLVTELIGQGINYVTGDYSRGAFGYWVENGEIVHPVEEITIAGNLRDMFKQIVAVGADTLNRGGTTSGSVLIEQMAVAGQ